jgi:L-seryl-tRNA(Ser) seleniumtransferase
MTELLKSPRVISWLDRHPRPLVTGCLRRALADLRQEIRDRPAGHCGPQHITTDALLIRAADRLKQAVAPQLREAINATGIILHTGLGRAVFPESAVDAIRPELTGCVTLAVSRNTGDRIERDELLEPLLTELTGAEAATVVNNNAAATLLALAALASGREVIVSRGHLIEIGGSFRLPEVMAQSGARLVEVGATNRTHLKDFRQAISPNTAAILRVHPSNYRIVGFTAEPALDDLATLAHDHNLPLLDDLGAGALVDLEPFGLPHEPTVRESIDAGADLVLFSGDKLIGASQSGIAVGRKPLIDRLRKHPLMRAVRVDKTCLLVLERTLHLFRRPDLLPLHHPTYRMLATPLPDIDRRAHRLADALATANPTLDIRIRPGVAYLGSGSLPTEAIPSVQIDLRLPGTPVTDLARSLRLDPACIFARIEHDRLVLDLRTVTDTQVPQIAAAFARLAPRSQ